ncbi:phage virion morphogenesis protein [Blastochloris tepida]|uniref:Virion morphogenesis protein n=1 Tax=Blastochloris tepida TaxID=2233851 RepID=A0A348FYH8_9HYPH|nr:phage virion morphogenesis protein [Blastochloris tepida]BBF92361.1 hypothetical protein BLTE_10460 [Blastochloris tepida]
MADAIIIVRAHGADEAAAMLARIGAIRFNVLMEGLGRLVQGQTRRRIKDEKRTPAGRAWLRTRDDRPALFQTGHHLHSSVDYRADPQQIVVGSGWIGAAVHQFGAFIVPRRAKALAFTAGGRQVFARRVMIPARTWLGLSSDNEQEIEHTTVRFLEGALK